MPHRASYWKTTAIAFAGAVVCLLALMASAVAPLPGLAHALIYAAASACALVLLLVVAGGLVCLWRDARESDGKEDFLARAAIKDPVRFPMRWLFGTRLRPGDLVAVRSQREVAATLDGNGTLGGMPFMREMEVFYGQVFRVHRRVDHINDMRNKTGLRRIHDVVTLTNVRCSGSDHGGCEAECQILWKDAWLKRVPAAHAAPRPITDTTTPSAKQFAGDEQPYFCQMTALWEASQPMSQRDPRLYLRPLLTGNVSLADFFVAVLTRVFEVAQGVRGGAGYPHMPRSVAQGRTPTVDSDLQPGDAVVVRGKHEIAATLVNGRNRGLWFDRDMIRFCGQPAIVHKRVSRLIHEGTGKMVVMKTPCLVLDDVVATGEFLRLCPQHEHIFWREIWLERAGNHAPRAKALAS